MLLQSYFPFPVLSRKTIFHCLLSQRLLYIIMTVKLPKVRNNLLEEINPKWDCIVSKNTFFQQILMGTEKKSKEIFRLQEKMEDKSKSQISIYLRTMNILTCKESKFPNLLYHQYHGFQQICSRNVLLFDSYYFVSYSK